MPTCRKFCPLHPSLYPSLSFFQVIAAIGEQKASKALQEAATVIAESPSALQVGPSLGTAGVNRRCGAGCALSQCAAAESRNLSRLPLGMRGTEEGTMSNLLLAEVFCRIRSREAFLPSFPPSLWRWSSHLPSVLKRRVIYWLLRPAAIWPPLSTSWQQTKRKETERSG